MNVSPLPARRLNNLNGRSRSPSPAANSTSNLIHNSPTTATHIARSNFLNPNNRDLHRTRRSVSPDFQMKENVTAAEAIPLIEAEKFDPPIANPETDDSGDDREVVTEPYPGVDDGLFITNRLNPDGPTIPGTDGNGVVKPEAEEPVDDPDGGTVFPRRNPMSPTDPHFNHVFPDVELGTQPDLESIPDINVYQHKKTLAQGMMDLALFSANANQLRYVLESDSHPYYYPGVILISISLIFQVAIGVGLIWNSRYNVKDEKQICIANKVNNFTTIGIFIVTVVNVFISAFGVASVQPVVAAPTNP